MLIRMRVELSGTRNGRRWPGRGETVEVLDVEGEAMCAAGIAEPVAGPERPVETATAPSEDVESRPAGTGPKTAKGGSRGGRARRSDG